MTFADAVVAYQTLFGCAIETSQDSEVMFCRRHEVNEWTSLGCPVAIKVAQVPRPDVRADELERLATYCFDERDWAVTGGGAKATAKYAYAQIARLRAAGASCGCCCRGHCTCWRDEDGS